jgi:hypothetical protein
MTDKQRYEQLEAAARLVLDESELEYDTMPMRELRKILWNETDTEAMLVAEGYNERKCHAAEMVHMP